MEVKKRIIPVFVAVLMVFTMMSMMAGTAFANEELYTQDGFLYKIIDTGSKEAVFIGIVDENGKGIDRIKGELTIPGGINYYGIWYPVIKIENNAFEYQRNLPSEIHTIIIASGSIRGTGGVEEIGERAFLACVGIKSVSLPRSLRKIGNYAFASCANLETVSFEDRSILETICDGAFENCYNLKEITIPSSVKVIERGAFEKCNSLTTIHYGGSRQQWEAIQGVGKPSIDLVEFNYPPADIISPEGTSIKHLTSAKKAVTVKWKKQPAMLLGSHINGYQIRLATDTKFTRNKKTVTAKGYKTVSKKIKNLKSKKKYYVKIRTYKSVGGEKYYSPWSKSMNVKTR